ncbi:rubredoxin-NAD+ reductase [Marinospirillum celere]|uniref:Rubredoxin-NAD+ reductase n=1 Tax=Marinospirillum celere TaxID=1122252 RepID=A0A1I1HYD9_9GAMM|nr:FAD-dependent oxidoreductase [Marinospirillum celere]SFC26988.1 rubredoxin-NAD+ reductase [Marinospirillum celere]
MSTATESNPLIILGSGMAAYQLALELRNRQTDLPLLLITRDSGHFYSKPLLSTALAKKQEAEQLIIADPAEQAEKLGIQIITFAEVQSIDREAQVVHLDEQSYSYSRLVLALGAEPYYLPAPPGALHTINDLDDYFVFRQDLAGKQRVAVIGGGLVGVEMAQDLLTAGYEVTLVSRSRSLLPGLLPPPVAEPLEQALIDKGLTLLKEESFKLIDGQPGSWHLELESGLLLEAEVVISALGLRPRTQLAEQAGLDVNRGIRVNRQLQTSDPAIYALGDCAEIDGQNLMYVQPLMASARTLADHLTGKEAQLELPALPVLVKTSSCPVVAAPPPEKAEGQWEYEQSEQAVEGRFLSPEGQLLGFALAGQAVRRKVQLVKEMPPLLG